MLTPRVSVVVLNHRGLEDTLACLSSLVDLDWPADDLEVVVVDQGSGGDDVDRLRAAAGGRVVVVENSNTGFAGGCNVGAARARGEIVAFLNNDAAPDPGWVREAVAVLDRDPDVAAVASQVRSWDGSTVEYDGGGMTFYGHGFQVGRGRPVSEARTEETDTLFGTGAALLVRRDVFRDIGGFDERFFMFFEDVDLGWRLWLLGWRVRYVPTSVVRHRHHRSMRRFGAFREHFLLERNALMSLYKNLDDGRLASFLPAAMALAARRGVVRAGAEPGSFAITSAPTDGDVGDRVDVSAEALVPTYALDAFVDLLPSLSESRHAIQSARRRGDSEILRLFDVTLTPNMEDERFLRGFRAVVEGFGVRSDVSTRRRIVVTTGEAVGDRMAGPAIRAWQMACALSAEHDVVLLTLGAAERAHPAFAVRTATPSSVREIGRRADVVVVQGAVLDRYPALARPGVITVVDLYDPYHLEALEHARGRGPAARADTVREAVSVVNAQLVRGDFFLCASEKQRDFWLGQLAAVGRLNPAVYDADQSMTSFVSVVPFGIQPEPPVPDTPRVKGVMPGISADDQLIVWGGGIYDWLDPLTLIEAMALLRERCPAARLLFLGSCHPNPHVAVTEMAEAARARSDDLGLTGQTVFFNAGWVPYAERGSWLCEASVGVSTHLDHVETAYSFRARILDYVWAGLPVVCTKGDAFHELVAGGLGLVVPPKDPEALADALARLLGDDAFADSCRRRAREVAPRYYWDEVLAPLVAFCREPRRAPDASLGHGLRSVARTTSVVLKPETGWRADVRIAVAHLRDGGPTRVARKAASRIRHRLRERRPRGASQLDLVHDEARRPPEVRRAAGQ